MRHVWEIGAHNPDFKPAKSDGIAAQGLGGG